ncbi:hypothetical protein N6L27_21705 [Leisingera sp. SS27]|uniref:hypothetical protein n=1 Tax=Leisingera sp. SS27 TaxID=2979462 RepID=UPI00232E3D38|nr:hypothetical protein [Leisingera sp. SS27]MDC0660629.1 hypothetical protein [Leisingera sp. SS27]
MLNRSLSLALMAVLLGTGAIAQSFMDRAAAAADGSVNTGSTFRDETINEVVTPYETSRPPEAGMRHTTFEDRILETRDADKTQGRVLRATEDSALIRPDIDIDGQGELFDDANWAHENAEDIAGRYFSSETGSCTTPEVPVSDVRDEFCESLPAREEKTCRLIRKIWVDRTDTYRCDRRASNFVQVCEKTNEYECKVNSNRAACIRRKVRITGGDVTWSGKTATISFPAASPTSNDGSSHLKKHRFSIEVSDRFAPDEVIMEHVEARGALQVLAGNTVVGTFSRTRTGHFLNGRGNACPANDTDGLLVPMVKLGPPSFNQNQRYRCFWGPPFGGGRVQPLAAIIKKPLAGGDALQPPASGPGVFSSGWDMPEGPTSWRAKVYRLVEHGNDKILQWFTCERLEHEFCHQMQVLTPSETVSKDVLRFINLNTYPRSRPDQGQRFRKTDFTARVVFAGGTSNGGRAKITIKFDGACCDSFRNVGEEVCE